jgi:hypothetical protein
MKRTFVLLTTVLFMVFSSCASGPAPQEIPEAPESRPPEPAAAAEAVQEAPEEEEFDPASISQEVFDTTMADVQQLIADLNRIIKAKNYNIWLSHLGAEYLDKINSEDFLVSVSSQPYMRNRKITLTSARDYFEKVVVPSRNNDRVDDIAFVSQNRVKVYTFDDKGERVRLYDLENLGGSWKIIN